MKVNINDIEDIIIAKIEIDKNNPDINERSPLQEFINTYCKVSWIILYKNFYIPFEIKTIFGNEYIFYSSDSTEEKEVLFNFLNKIKNNISNLNKISNKDLIENGLQEDKLYVIINNEYFQV